MKAILIFIFGILIGLIISLKILNIIIETIIMLTTIINSVFFQKRTEDMMDENPITISTTLIK